MKRLKNADNQSNLTKWRKNTGIQSNVIKRQKETGNHSNLIKRLKNTGDQSSLKEYHTIETVPKSKQKFEETWAKSILLHTRLLTVLAEHRHFNTSGGIKLVDPN